MAFTKELRQAERRWYRSMRALLATLGRRYEEEQPPGTPEKDDLLRPLTLALAAARAGATRRAGTREEPGSLSGPAAPSGIPPTEPPCRSVRAGPPTFWCGGTTRAARASALGGPLGLPRKSCRAELALGHALGDALHRFYDPVESPAVLDPLG